MKILSNGKFKEFDGFISQGKAIVRKFILSNGKSIRATLEHKFLLEGDLWVTAELLDVGDTFSTGVSILGIEESANEVDVFDALNVQDTHSYWTEGIISHNCNLLYIDEAAFVNGWTDFSASVLPTISSGKKTKLIFTSTPNGLNHFYDYYNGAKKGTNGFKLIEVKWYDVPGRNEEWRQETLATINHDEERFAQEYEVSFLGSSGTLISGAKLKELFTDVRDPQFSNEGYGYKVYSPPKEKRLYTIIVDVSRGKGQDYSAFQVIDTTEVPYKQVAVFRNNMISPTDYARFIYETAKGYNNSYVLIELNDIGGQVADLLSLDYEYENVIYTSGAGPKGKKVTFGYGDSVDRGIRTTKTVKGLGCSMLKLLIEQDKLKLSDADTIQELAVFSQKGVSYEAEEGYHDDTVMCLVLFAWLTTDDFFKNMNDENVLHSLRELTDKQIEETLTPFGVYHNGVDDVIVEEWGGERWELESGVFENHSLSDYYSEW